MKHSFALGLLACWLLGLGTPLAAQEVAGIDTSISRVRADSLRSTMTPDTGLETKLAAAQAAWDKGAGLPAAAGSPVSGSLGGLLLQVFASLSVLVLAALALLVLMQRAKRRKSANAGTGAGMIDLLESKAVGPSRQVSLIRLHNRVVAVAFAGPSATLLCEFTGNDAAEIVAESGTGKTSIRDFSATLDTLMDKFRIRPGEKAERQEPTP